MGIFSSLKKNLSHGGVKLKLDAPASISMAKGEVLVTVEITATDSAAKVNGVLVELTKERPAGTNPDGSQNSGIPRQSMSKAEDTKVFELKPGESKTVEMKLLINLGNAVADMVDNPAAKQIAKGLGMLEELADHASKMNDDYYIIATVRVEGLKLQPSTQQRVQLVKPGEFGAAKNITL